MRRWVRANWLRWLVAWGISLPGGMGYADLRVLLWPSEQPDSPGKQEKGRTNHPPPHGPERLAAPDLTPVEQELWLCLQGEHGADCAGNTLTGPAGPAGPTGPAEPTEPVWHPSPPKLEAAPIIA